MLPKILISCILIVSCNVETVFAPTDLTPNLIPLESPSFCKSADLNESKDVLIEDVNPEPIEQSLGQFKLTAYCACSACCGKSDGITASGTKATANRTIAVDRKKIPLGSKVRIGDIIYTAEDVGGAIKGNKIDIYFDSHQKALNFGVQYKEVYLITE